jgi:hypothetical protein
MASAPSPPSAATTKQWILLGVLAGILVLVLAVLVVRPMLAGDKAPPPDASAAAPTETTIATPAPGTGETATPAPDASAPRSLDPAIAARAVKDPFRSLIQVTQTTNVIEESPAPNPVAVPAPTNTTSSDTTTPAGTPTDTTLPDSSGDGDASTRQEISLNSIDGSGGDARVSVTIDGTAYSGQEGDTLASTYEVVEISSDCADFRTDSDAFTLCEGQSALK